MAKNLTRGAGAEDYFETGTEETEGMDKAHQGPRAKSQPAVRRQERPLEVLNGQLSISGNIYTTTGCICSRSIGNASCKNLITSRALQFTG